jgi:transposase-like protein
MLKIRVKCPYCGFEQVTTTIKRVKCFRCMKTYPVFYKNRRWTKSNNIVRLEEGTLEELHKLYYEEFVKKRNV